MKPLEMFVWFSIIGSLIIGIKHRVLVKTNINKLYPYFIMGIMLILGVSVSYTGMGTTLEDNSWAILKNSVELIRNSIFALIGLILFLLSNDELKPLQSWEDGFKFLEEVPVNYILKIIFGFTTYSFLVFYFLKPEYIGSKESDFYHFIGMAVLSMLAALNEELLFRMYVIGLIVYFLKKYRAKWWVAIVLSSALWAYVHMPLANLGWVKFIQVFPLGIALGYTLKRFGFETCVFLHIVFNLVIIVSFQVL